MNYIYVKVAKVSRVVYVHAELNYDDFSCNICQCKLALVNVSLIGSLPFVSSCISKPRQVG
jgi:hypothetical protein